MSMSNAAFFDGLDKGTTHGRLYKTVRASWFASFILCILGRLVGVLILNFGTLITMAFGLSDGGFIVPIMKDLRLYLIPISGAILWFLWMLIFGPPVGSD